ncbi:MAG: HDOD domain-containing protein [Pseudomonadota bacterium]
MTQDAERALSELAAKGVRIPPQPQVLVRLQQAIAGDDYSIKQLADIIATDPGLTAMLFKVARAPVFGGARRIDSVEQVLMVIGVKQSYNLVQAASLSVALSDAARQAFEHFWQRSQEVAQLAALIAADRVSVCNIFPDQAYMAGIFHECGVPVLMLRFPDYCDKLNLKDACCWPNLSDEDAHFQLDHSSVGYLVARHWKLPDFICQAILYHHELPDQETGTVRTLVAILQLAIHYYHRMSRVADPVWDTLGQEVLAELGISADMADEYYETIIDRFHG